MIRSVTQENRISQKQSERKLYCVSILADSLFRAKSMKTIPLTQNKFTIIDDEDYEWLIQWKWHAYRHSNNYRAVRWTPQTADRKQKIIFMHRLIIGPPNNMVIDHINHNTLDNRRLNLRVCSVKENTRNMLKSKKSSSIYKGVRLRKDTGKWTAQIRVDLKLIHLGQFKNEVAAAKAYDKAAITYFGEFANLNLGQNTA